MEFFYYLFNDELFQVEPTIGTEAISTLKSTNNLVSDFIACLSNGWSKMQPDILGMAAKMAYDKPQSLKMHKRCYSSPATMNKPNYPLSPVHKENRDTIGSADFEGNVANICQKTITTEMLLA